MHVDAHVIGDAVMVVAQGLVHAVNGGFLALASIGQPKIPARVAMKVIFLPLVGIHVLIGVVKVFATEGLRLLETVGGHGEVDVQHQ